MGTIKKIQIKNSGGTYDENKIGAEAQDVEISYDSNGKIIPDITASGVTVSSTKGVAEALKDIDERKATTSSLGQVSVGTGLSVDSNGEVTPNFGNTAGSVCEGNDTRLSNIGTTTNKLTLSNDGSGATSGTEFNGSAAVKISYNSIGAAKDQKATTSQWGQVKVKASSGLGIDSTNGLSLENHASSATTYGKGSSSNFGHLKVVDANSSTYNSTTYNASNGYAASAYSVAALNNDLTKHGFGTVVSINADTDYTAPSDGIFRVVTPTTRGQNVYASLRVNGTSLQSAVSYPLGGVVMSTPVRKGMVLNWTQSGATNGGGVFIPLT